jgi:hypothetical protein
MSPEKLLRSRRMFVSIEDDLPEAESTIILTRDQVFRNRLVARLALIDQKMAELRDRIGFSDCTD